jgi:hypothetical protein
MIIKDFENFKDIVAYLDSQKKTCFFRGQSPENRLLNCTLARELRKETQHLPRKCIPSEPLPEWTIYNLCGYLLEFCYKWFSYKDVFSPVGGDRVYELIRHLQQEPDKPKIRGRIIANHPTPALEFSESYLTALYFASKKDAFEGGIFLIKRKDFEVHISFAHALFEMAQEMVSTPCLIDPLRKINDIEQLKIKRQKPVYIFQRDLRVPIDHYLEIQKIILRKEWHKAIQTFLAENGVTENFIYGKNLN